MRESIKEIIETMEDYLGLIGEECSYNKNSINKFKKISMNYKKNASCCKDIEEFEKVTINFIEELNNLNKESNNELIETDQRELIVSMIEELANEKNFEFEGDFTEAYRQW